MSYEKQELIDLIDPYRRKPELRNKTVDELAIMFNDAYSHLYRFKLEHYNQNSKDIVNELFRQSNDLALKQAELDQRALALNLKESQLQERERKLREEIYVRPPDPVIRQRLVDPVSIDEDPAFLAAIEESRREADRRLFEASQLITSTDFFEENKIKTVSQPIESVTERTVNLDMSKFEGAPEGINQEFLTNLYFALESQNFDQAKELWKTLPGSASNWLGYVKCGNTTLKKKLLGSSPDAYKCLVI